MPICGIGQPGSPDVKSSLKRNYGCKIWFKVSLFLMIQTGINSCINPMCSFLNSNNILLSNNWLEIHESTPSPPRCPQIKHHTYLFHAGVSTIWPICVKWIFVTQTKLAAPQFQEQHCNSICILKYQVGSINIFIISHKIRFQVISNMAMLMSSLGATSSRHVGSTIHDHLNH